MIEKTKIHLYNRTKCPQCHKERLNINSIKNSGDCTKTYFSCLECGMLFDIERRIENGEEIKTKTEEIKNIL